MPVDIRVLALLLQRLKLCPKSFVCLIQCAKAKVALRITLPVSVHAYSKTEESIFINLSYNSATQRAL